MPDFTRLTGFTLERLFPGDNEMARRMRAFNWAASDFGPVENWPDHLRVAVSICLACRFPVFLWWGTKFNILYNDACLPWLTEAKHPRALGRPGIECWPEIWGVIGPLMESVLATGEANWSEEMELYLARRLPQEEVYITYTFAPILAADGQTVDGIFNPCTENTAQIVGGRRLEALRKLGIRSPEIRTVEAACQQVAAVLSENPRDLPFAAIYLVDPTGTEATISAAVIPEGDDLLPRLVSLSADDSGSPWPLAAVLRTKRSVEIENLGSLVGRIPGKPWPELVKKAMALPIYAAADTLAGLFVAGVGPRRSWDAAYGAFFEQVAGQIGSAISAAKACEDECQRAGALARERDLRESAEASEARAREELLAETSSLNRLRELRTSLLSKTELQPLLDEVLTATMALKSAHFGDIQLYNRANRSLTVVAQQGFSAAVLAHFRDYQDETTMWDRALARGERVVVEDVWSDAGFAPHRELAEAAGYRAGQSTPLFSRNGEPLGVISTFFREPHLPSARELRFTDLYARLAAELIERQQSEEALRASEARFRNYFELGLIGMTLTSPTKGVLEVNDELCHILRYSRDEMLQKTWAEMTHPDDLAADVHQFNRVMAGEIDGYSLDKRWIRKDGQAIHSIMSARCLRCADGSVDYFVGLVLDTTERKHAEEALQKLQAELAHVARVTTMGELAATIAHELNQPLGAIVNNANVSLKIAAAERKNQDEFVEVLSDIVKDAERASAIVARIRGLMKRSTPGREPLQFHGLVQDVLALARREFSERGIAVCIELSNDLPPVLGDRVQLQQVLLNLMINGAEAMSAVPGPRRILTIGGRCSESNGEPAVLISVNDLGCGLGAQNPERLFETFYTTKPNGVGMGLRISRSIVEAHGGRLWAQANADVGATFLFFLPVFIPR